MVVRMKLSITKEENNCKGKLLERVYIGLPKHVFLYHTTHESSMKKILSLREESPVTNYVG